jgi:two-component system sensor histidine kinase UhpB
LYKETMMDLRRRLLGYLGVLLLGLLIVTLAISLLSLRSDVRNEVIASERLASVLLDASRIGSDLSPAESASRMAAILNGGPLRHLSVSMGAESPPQENDSAVMRLAGLLGVETAGMAVQMIQFGDQTLRIAPNPASEIEERLGDTVRLCVTLLLFSGTTLLVVWWSADHALAPVRDLEAGLQRLAGGAEHAALPAFALREFMQVASAIDNLAIALATSREAQRHLSRQLIQVQEDERRTLAMELHDEMGQTLTAIGVTAAYLERNAGRLEEGRIVECARDVRRDVRTSGVQLRAMLNRLRPHGLDGPGLASALRELLDSWQQRAAGICFTLEMPARLPVFSESVGLVLYRVVQEALTNVVRHSAAKNCAVRIGVDMATLTLRIEDNGRGMAASDDADSALSAAEARAGAAGGSGLLGIEERLHMVKGQLRITPGASHGVLLQITLPLKQQQGGEQEGAQEGVQKEEQKWVHRSEHQLVHQSGHP